MRGGSVKSRLRNQLPDCPIIMIRVNYFIVLDHEGHVWKRKQILFTDSEGELSMGKDYLHGNVIFNDKLVSSATFLCDAAVGGVLLA